MWLFVFFDLPTTTKKERKAAAQFRKALEKENMNVHITRVRASMPPSGLTSILSITDKQYGEIQNFWGKVERAKLTTPQQLEIF